MRPRATTDNNKLTSDFWTRTVGAISSSTFQVCLKVPAFFEIFYKILNF